MDPELCGYAIFGPAMAYLYHKSFFRNQYIACFFHSWISTFKQADLKQYSELLLHKQLTQLRKSLE